MTKENPMKHKIIHGDCLDAMKQLDSDSIDAVITDPPYGLGFMGKEWDTFKPEYIEKHNKNLNKELKIRPRTDGRKVPATGISMRAGLYDLSQKGMLGYQNWYCEVMKECLRVLKPGGHLLSFGGTRTYHRMAVAIEDAGFEVRDMINWVYGSGFPKSLNIGKSIDKLLGNEREWISVSPYKASDEAERASEGKCQSGRTTHPDITKGTSEWEGWGTALKPSHEPVVFCSKPLTPRLYFAILIGDISNNIIQLCQISNVKNAEKIFSDFQAKLEKEGVLSVADNVKMNAWESLENVKFAEQSFISSEQKSSDLIKTKENSAQSNVRQSGNEDKTQEIKTPAGVEVNIKALMDIIIFGTTEDTSQNIALLWNSILEDLLNQANTLTIKMATRLITDLKILKLSATQSILESTGSLLKTPQNIPPNHEPICMARKPLSEKTVAENCLKWGTGGINIDESRVETSDKYSYPNGAGGNSFSVGEEPDGKRTEPVESNSLGRFPANLIHDNSEEVRECFPETNPSKKAIRGIQAKGYSAGIEWEKGSEETNTERGHNDSGGSASRFFKSIIYTAKASKSERNAGCEGLELRPGGSNAKGYTQDVARGLDRNRPVANNHPTVKPIALMSYLIKMITPPKGVVLDPFMGSGSTGVACKQNGYQFIGIEKEPEYVRIAEARINAVPQTLL